MNAPSLTQPSRESTEGRILAESGKYLTFSLGNESYGLHVGRVREIIQGNAGLTWLPDLPEFVKGCLNLRGKVIPVIDLRLRFQVPPQDDASQNCIVIGEVLDRRKEKMLVGLIVDAVEEVTQISKEDLEPAPEFGAGLQSDFILGIAKIGGRLKTLLNMDRVFAASLLQHLNQQVEESTV